MSWDGEPQTNRSASPIHRWQTHLRSCGPCSNPERLPVDTSSSCRWSLLCELLGKAWIPWKEEVTKCEVRACTISHRNTCPGADKITVELLAACWNSIEAHVTNLFRACILLRYHTKCLKLAEMVFLAKAGRDPALAKGYRQTLLLSCLGMHLERLITKRISHLAIVADIAGKQQFGALLKRSATVTNEPVWESIREPWGLLQGNLKGRRFLKRLIVFSFQRVSKVSKVQKTNYREVI